MKFVLSKYRALLLVFALFDCRAQLRTKPITTRRRHLLVDVSIQGDNWIPMSAFPLGKCQGDCDSSDQCEGKLVCYQRESGNSVPPGCSGTPTGNKDYCYDPNDSTEQPLAGSLGMVGDNGIPASVFPLGRCLGDCDSDSQCEGNLRCFQRNQGDPGPPGCTGMAVGATDYCYEVVVNVGDLVLAGDNGDPAFAFPLEHCQGDCDSDNDCAGDLACFQRSAEQLVPGCSGTPKGSKDYCIRRKDLPGGLTASPAVAPSQSSMSPVAMESEATSRTITFYAIGDVPYTDDQRKKLTGQMTSLKNDADFLIHLGDIRSNNKLDCQNTEFSGLAEMLKLSPIPVFIIPGDNEYTGKYRELYRFGMRCGIFDLNAISLRFLDRLSKP